MNSKARIPLWDVSIKIPPKIHSVVGVRRTLLSLFEFQKLSAELKRTLNLVLTEALNNAIENRKAGSKRAIELEFRLYPGQVWLAVRGESEKDALTSLRRALAHSDLLDMDGERGRGLFLMRTMMDEVGLHRLSGNRIELWMQKSF